MAPAVADLTAPSLDSDRWDALLLCVAAYILTSVARVHQLFGGLEVLHLAAIAGVLSIALYVVDGRDERRFGGVLVGTTSLLAVLVFWMMLSVPAALSVGNSVNLVFNDFIKTVVMSLVIAAAVRSARDVERLTGVYFVGAVIYATVVLMRFDVGSGADWRLNKLYDYDANDFATFAVSAMPFGIYFAQTGARRMHRLAAVGGLALLTLGFVWSGSRGGFIALMGVGLFVVARFTSIPLRQRLWATAVVIVVVIATASDQYWQQMGTITSADDYNHTSETGRLQIWSRGIGYIAGNPMLGVGPGNFQMAEGTLSAIAERQQFGIGVRWNAAHNSFVQIGAEIGLPGLLLYIALLASAFAALRRAARSDVIDGMPAERRRALSAAVAASVLGFVIGSFFLSLAYSEMLYTLLAFSIGLQKRDSEVAFRRRVPPAPLRPSPMRLAARTQS